jgi:hypothetical protein
MANIREKLNNFVVKEGKHETEETSVTQNSSTKNVGNSEDQIPTADQVSNFMTSQIFSKLFFMCIQMF